MNNKLICLDSVDSTNTYLKKMAREGCDEGTVVIADSQTAGRGRMGRAFYSKSGAGVYLSVLLKPECNPEEAGSLTPHVAVAVCKAIERVCNVKPDIKWVNDLLIGGKKICGVLCESSIGPDGMPDYIVCGVGVNVLHRTEDFPDAIKDIAGSIYTQCGIEAERGTLIAAIVEEIMRMYALWKRDRKVYLEDYRARCITTGKYIQIKNGSGIADAYAKEISEDFGLTVNAAGGTVTLRSGEVSIINE